MHNASPLLTLQNLSVTFKGRHHDARAVEQVSLAIRSGELLGLAGESGCGKSTLAYALMGLLDPAQTQLQGLCHFDGQNYDLAQVQLPKSFRGQHIAMVFQSAMNALNPVLTVAAQLDDAILAHRHDWTATQRLQRIHEVLDLVDIPRNRLHAYPHQLSGGMKQRIGIAMALLHQPQLLILDEPTTALDVVVQRAIIQRIATLRHELGFAVLFITHDLSLLAEISDRIAIMYAGQIVEISPTRTLYQHPAHPYTQALLKAFPSLTDTHNNFAAIEGSPPPLTDLPIGCRFAPRCAKAQAQCTREMPALLELHERPQQVCRCWLTMPQGDR